MQRHRGIRSTGIPEDVLGYLMVAPALLCILMIAIYPVFRTFSLSMTNMKMQFPDMAKYIGLNNYAKLLQDSRFWSATYNTLFFTVVSVAMELVIGFAMALIMNMPFKGRGLVRAAVLVPWAIPTTVSATMWKFMYHDQFGVINDILLRMGFIDQYRSWLGSTSSALWCAIIADVWKTAPFMGLLLLAGLQTIPGELYEAATVDGATRIKQFFSVTLPLIMPTMLVALIFRTLDAFRVFDLIFVLTGGGPGNSTETLSMYAYTTLFRNLDFGLGSAIAVLIFIFVFLISLVYINLLSRQND
ncbi:carbohydrate ABC transporter permease [Mahella australiensis]|uniref:Carbohydrate ABC transporter membrane protein 1, CUT1 family n=1 Tax=Mahella australiensis (strain DSM 15567 / CIP 107919 / 50-1 BON) TaxID=697281 RepID=F3ZVM1_MAHA5|nr:sugar ABC transporter permease [Mahella australiensis]AEE96383.1 carbohydrate ABC transporter membrane protein 1, CUT1 family [Mahella australiensis 50-1 BON]